MTFAAHMIIQKIWMYVNRAMEFRNAVFEMACIYVILIIIVVIIKYEGKR